MLEISEKEIRKCANDFYSITHLGFELYDENKNELFRYPEKKTSFCNVIGNIPKFKSSCDRCNVYGFQKCTELRKPYIYRCHMGLTEVFAPIIENDIIIGYITLGHIIRRNDEQNIKKNITKKAKKLNINHTELIEALKSLVVIDEEYLVHAIRLISMCACYLYMNKLIKRYVNTIQFQIDEYIHQNLNKDLSVDKLCTVFRVSRSKLYNISNISYGMGISDYIRDLRIDEAKKLLSTTHLPIHKIAEMEGFMDVNYFIRLFKKKEGITPNSYKTHYHQ